MQVILIGVISTNNVIPQIGTNKLVYFQEKRVGMYLTSILSNIMGSGPDSLLSHGNTCSCRNWEWDGRYWDTIPFRIHQVLDSALPVYTMPNLFWNDDHFPSTSANTSCICRVNCDITVGVSFRCGCFVI